MFTLCLIKFGLEQIWFDYDIDGILGYTFRFIGSIIWIIISIILLPIDIILSPIEIIAFILYKIKEEKYWKENIKKYI